MQLECMQLKNFRNYDCQEVFFGSKINVFSGDNGQGKTNLLESIYYLTVSRSFRTNQESDLIGWGDESFYIKGSLKDGEKKTTLETGYQENKGLQIKVNGKIFKRSEFICLNPIVIFNPDDLLLIKEGPALRRRFLNMEGSRLWPLYYKQLRSYHRVVQQRNRLLKEAAFSQHLGNTIETWDESLITLGSSLIKQRLSLLRQLESQGQLFFEELTGRLEKIKLNYLSSIPCHDEEKIEEKFRDKLKRERISDLKRGYSTIGPHVDDFTVLINGFEAKKFASQGQQRTAVLALKMGEVALFSLINGKTPIILLDDVFSEFDKNRRQQLLRYLVERQGQSFLTTAASVNQLFTGLNEDCQIFSVNKGKINNERT